MRQKKQMKCTNCGSEAVKKNGHTHYNKQNYQCKNCGTQFVENGQNWFVSQAEKETIKKLLLERISLRGICRVCGVSMAWLMTFIKKVYSELPTHMNIEEKLPEIKEYLDDRMDEEIIKLMDEAEGKKIEKKNANKSY